jgi:formylglycine-generating enzyme required for sulfatase activity
MVFVEGGTFMMGSEDGYDSEKPAHRVTLDSFEIGKYPVTQAQWQAVMGSNPSHFKSNPQHPVEMVSWNEVQEFIKKLDSMTDEHYRLPTEAEWEYAARGGKKSKGYRYAGSNDAAEVAWYDGNSRKNTQPVGQKKPNELGLYDMSGNVYEWCLDFYDEDYYKKSPTRNPMNNNETTFKVLRGGSWGVITLYSRLPLGTERAFSFLTARTITLAFG